MLDSKILIFILILMKENLCKLCPRNCNVDRTASNGYCKSSNTLRVSKVMIHKFEEPCLVGFNKCVNENPGSGAIFFSGCNLRCIFCQNYNISQLKHGKEISVATLISLFKQLEAKGVLNINLVTPTHFTNEIIEALKTYKPKVPVVWNSSGYESPQTIEKLKNLVDIFLVDFKYFSDELALEFSNANNYPEFAKNVLLTCRKLQPNDEFDSNGIMKKGLIVRHLCLPNCIEDSKNIIDWIKQNLGNQTILSLMSQYVPMYKALNNTKINRKLKPLEYKIAVNYLYSNGFKNAYIQDFDSQSEDYTPDFEEFNNDFDY